MDLSHGPLVQQGVMEKGPQFSGSGQGTCQIEIVLLRSVWCQVVPCCTVYSAVVFAIVHAETFHMERNPKPISQPRSENIQDKVKLIPK